ncbi:unnamed protein product [Arabis nemorensis]|uniref:Exocyst subunit Exo70 family protein n=1 Tax=Arabis nemorensis TaxID=586526 RepID=A0A565CUZ4_9BRAS|nr:unnamed protein product [Arabis nemorensis]
MAEFESKLPVPGVKNHVFEACHHVIKALRASDNNLDANLRKLLSDLESQLSTFGMVDTKVEDTGFSEIKERFKEAQKRILSWETKRSMIFEAGLSEADQFFQALYEVQTVIMGFNALPIKTNQEKDVYNQATVALDIGMLRLEKELCDVLYQHKQHVKPEYLDGSSRRKDIVYDESFVSLDDEVVVEASSSEDDERTLGIQNADLVDPLVVPHVKAIANAMFACEYDQAFREAFISVRREALGEYMVTLEMERLSCVDVLKMEWEDLNGAMRKWTRVFKIITQVYLASEKKLCEQILGDFESISTACFIEISKDTILSLLNFGEAVVLRSCQPEMLERFLSMYEVSAELLLDVDNLFPDETGVFLRMAFHELSRNLAGRTTATFLKFKDAIASNESSRAFPGGQIHHLTRYVMNYLKLLPEYADTLNLLLQNLEVDDSIPEKTGEDILPSTFSPMAKHLRSIATTLESSLNRKAQLYADESLKFIFLINNFHYMVQKVKGSELRYFFGDEWIKKHIARYQHDVTNYERSTWSSILSLLKDNNNSVATLREKCRLFALAFDDVYKNQTRWSVPDPELRDDIHISTSVKVVQSYRGFLGRNATRIGEKHIRYTCEDIENMLLDLFECLPSPRSLRSSRRR